MKKIALAGVSVALLALAGCNTSSSTDRTLVGGGLGAATGAAIGAATGGGVGDALAGAAIGGVAGGIIGNVTTPKNCTAYDQYGRPYRVKCP